MGSIRVQNTEPSWSCHAICQFLLSDHLLDFSLAFFSLIESVISEQASRQVATEEPNKGCKHAKRRNWRSHNLRRDENLQRENEMTFRVLKVFTLKVDYGLRAVTKVKRN